MDSIEMAAKALASGSVGTAILQALAEGEGYGLEVIDRVKRRTRGAIELHQGNLYPWLRLLERDGLLRSWDGEATLERGGQPRRYYAVTPVGWDVARPLRGTFDPKSPLPIGGRAPIVVRGVVARMTPPSRFGLRLKDRSADVEVDMEDSIAAIFRSAKKKRKAHAV